MSAPNIVGPVNGIVLAPAAPSIAYQVSTVAVLKSAAGLCVSLICVGAGTIGLFDASATANMSSSNQFYSGTLSLGQTLQLNNPCAAGIAASAGGTFNVLFA